MTYGTKALPMNEQCDFGLKSSELEILASKMSLGSGRPTVIQEDILRGIVEADPAKSTRQIAQEMNVDQKTVVRHLAIIGKVKKLDKWVPANLTDRYKMQQFEVSSTLLLRNRNDPFLERIVTCDEKWIL